MTEMTPEDEAIVKAADQFRPEAYRKVGFATLAAALEAKRKKQEAENDPELRVLTEWLDENTTWPTPLIAKRADALLAKLRKARGVTKPCRSGDTDCTVDCGWCKGSGHE